MTSVSVDANDNRPIPTPSGLCAIQSMKCSPHDSAKNNNQFTMTTASDPCHSHLFAAEARNQSDDGSPSFSPVGSPPVVLDARRRRCSAPGMYHKFPLSDGSAVRKLSSPLIGSSIQFIPTPPPSPSSHRGLVVNEPYVFAWTQVAAAASNNKGHVSQAPDNNRTNETSRRLSDPGCSRRWGLDTHWPLVVLRAERRDHGIPPPRAAAHCPLLGTPSSLSPTAQGDDGRNPRLTVTPSSPISGSDDTGGGSTGVTTAPTRRHSVALGHLSVARYLEAIAEETGIARTTSGLNDAGAAAVAMDATDGVLAQSVRRHSLTGNVNLSRPED